MTAQQQPLHGRAVILADVTKRAEFLMRTYLHLFGAIMGFTLIEVYLFSSGLAYAIAEAMLSVSWLLVLGGFIIVGAIASDTAHRASSLVAQYASLALYVVAEAIIFVPLLVIAESSAPGVIESGTLITLVAFLGLTGIVYFTRRDFAFLRAILMWGGVIALTLIVAAITLNLLLGTLFSVVMVALAGGYILYDTSNVLHHYPEDRYVGASLELFASVALMFWYVIRLFLSIGE